MTEPEETPIAWTAIVAHCPVIASDGKAVGTVTEVAALPEEDIFHGVVFQHNALSRHLLVPASDVEKITDRAVYIKPASDDAGAYAEFQEMEVDKLGVRGLFFWKHLGWTRSKE